MALLGPPPVLVAAMVVTPVFLGPGVPVLFSTPPGVPVAIAVSRCAVAGPHLLGSVSEQPGVLQHLRSAGATLRDKVEHGQQEVRKALGLRQG